jgi:hypothetical protein
MKISLIGKPLRCRSTDLIVESMLVLLVPDQCFCSTENVSKLLIDYSNNLMLHALWQNKFLIKLRTAKEIMYNFNIIVLFCPFFFLAKQEYLMAFFVGMKT